jgi:peptidyl-prolyl cis-trans isomerase SurA
MVKNSTEDSIYAKNKIIDIYNKLKQGDDFAKIAQEHSDDQGSSKKGGVLPKFGSGRMINSFDVVAFNLKNEGNFSEPFKTKYGWHILKLLKKYPVKSYDELHNIIESKIKNGSRSKYVENALADKLAKKYEITENKEILALFYSSNINEKKTDSTILIIEDEVYTSNDFYNYINKNKNEIIEKLFIDFKNKKIIEYYKNHLEYTNKEFAIIYQEYKDGLLLFELLQQNIWEKSEKDSIGLFNYFEANKNNYTWKKRGNLTIASCTNNVKAQLVKNYLEEGKSIDEIKSLVNDGATIHVLFSSGKLEEGSSKLPEKYKMTIGVSKIFTKKKNQFTIIKVTDISAPVSKKLKDTRGEVINDYQNYLEEQWVKDLRQTYHIKINKKTLKKLKLQFDEL